MIGEWQVYLWSLFTHSIFWIKIVLHQVLLGCHSFQVVWSYQCLENYEYNYKVRLLEGYSYICLNVGKDGSLLDSMQAFMLHIGWEKLLCKVKLFNIFFSILGLTTTLFGNCAYATLLLCLFTTFKDRLLIISSFFHLYLHCHSKKMLREVW